MGALAMGRVGDRAVTLGIVIMVLASLLTPVPDAIAKTLGERHGMPATVIALARFVFQSLTALPVLLGTKGLAGIKVRRPGLNLLRGALMAVGSTAFSSR